MAGADYARRFGRWEFWVASAAILFDLISFAVPMFALAFLVVLLHPEGWRGLAWLAETVHRMQEGSP